jgi:hypothetical protein
MQPVDPLTLAKLLNLRQIDWVPHLGVSPVWARTLAHNPLHARRVRIAVLKAALERDRFEESIVVGNI